MTRDGQNNPETRLRLGRPRGSKPPLQLTARDRELFRHLWESRFLTRRLIAALFPPASGLEDSDHTWLDRRLKRLWERGYVDRFQPSRGSELAYGLGPRGAEELVRCGHPVKGSDWKEKNRDVTAFFINHALVTARLRVALHIALPYSHHTALDTFQREKQALRAVWRHKRDTVSLSPDAFFILRDRSLPEGRQRFPYLVEADRSTMVLERLAQKLRRYVWLFEDGAAERVYRVSTFRVLIVCKSRERRDNIVELLGGPHSPVPVDHREFVLVGCEDAYATHLVNALAAIWLPADNPKAPRGLTGSPIARAGPPLA